MVRKLVGLGVILTLAGCAQPVRHLPPSPEGYRALRFTQQVRFRVGPGYEFPAGAMLVQDRVRERDGVELWCGQYRLLNLGGTASTCAQIDGQTISFDAEKRETGHPAPLRPGTTEIIRAR